SREARRLRRAGFVPGIVYGGDQEPVPFQIDARELRNALARAGAVLDLQLDDGPGGPVVLKELVRHPVTGLTTHLDLLRVNLNETIQTQVTVELLGAEEAPGARQGGILEHILREVTVEALPNEIPDSISLDVSELKVGETITLSALRAPGDVTIMGDPEAAVVTITASRASRATGGGDEIETETELVGESDAEAEAKADGDTADEAAAAENND
ncbi:MAG TPA: 50S ribosomal protein L25, partial [Solirubrobacteraceae bacterium]|nr:50S ribosomal protein L25 [Solirubrobacteraceae bacterium]